MLAVVLSLVSRGIILFVVVQPPILFVVVRRPRLIRARPSGTLTFSSAVNP
jgi:hypothetical protein